VLLALAYGGLLAIFASEVLRVWSAMHSVAVVGLLVLGLPTLLIQNLAVLEAAMQPSRFHVLRSGVAGA
jgi:hypothetical protein